MSATKERIIKELGDENNRFRLSLKRIRLDALKMVDEVDRVLMYREAIGAANGKEESGTESNS